MAILEQGLIIGLMALGVYISFRIVDLPDLTTDGSFALGAAVAVRAVVAGIPAWLAITLAAIFGAVAGSVTGTIHRKFKVNVLLAGILVMTMLYSVNLRVMGGPNLPVPRVVAEKSTQSFEEMSGGTGLEDLFGELEVKTQERALKTGSVVKNIFNNDLDGSDLLLIILIISAVIILLTIILRSDPGMVLRAFGSNPSGIVAFGVSQDTLAVVGLTISNFIVGLSGGLFALYSGFSDATIGQGMVVTGLASVIMGEILLGRVKLFYGLLSPIIGGVIYQTLLSLAMRYGYRIGFLASDMKLLTALFIIVVIGLRQISTADGKRKVKLEVKKLWSNSKVSQ
jgi:putative ABC transport system permease protein